MKKKQNDNPLPKELYEYMARTYLPHTMYSMDLHHALVDKGDVRGMSLSERKKIHDPRNLWWVVKSEHASHANIASKQVYYQLLCNRFGEDEIDAFIRSFNWKVKPPFTLEWLKGDKK